jgi:hypothetical protein
MAGGMKPLRIALFVLLAAGAAAHGQCASPVGQGEYDFYVVPLALDRADTGRLLPPGLRASGKGRQSLVSLWFGRHEALKVPPWPKWSFGEFLVYVPNAEREDEPGVLYNYAPLLLLDHLPALWLGRLLGLRKERAQIEAGPGTVRVSRGKETLVEASFRPSGEWADPSEVAHFAALESHFKNPTILKRGRRWLSLRYDSGLGEGSFNVRPVEARVHLKKRFLAGLPVGEFLVPALDRSESGAFQVRAKWCLERPR